MIRKGLCLVIPSLQPGGMERVMSELADYFSYKKNLRVDLVLYGKNTKVFYEIPDLVNVHLPKVKFNDSFRLLSSVRRLIFLRVTIKKINPDSILSFGEYWNSFVLLSLLGLSYPVFISDRCSPVKRFDSFHSLLRKWLYPKAKGIIAQTEKARKIYLEQFKHPNIKVIGNPIREVSLISDNPRENIILTVGRLIRSKNHDKLIRLFSAINLPGWTLIIVGDDALKQNHMVRLKALIKELNAENKVIMAGNQAEVEHYYLKSKIFAFTSDSEGFPNVIGEAQSYGLPVIAFDCIAGPADLVINNTNGFLIPLNDYDLFQEKLTMLMNNEELRKQFGTNAKESIKKFSAKDIGDQFCRFILD